MNSQPAEIKQPLDDSLTEAQIQTRIEEMKRDGAQDCRVVEENGLRFLVCTFPPL